MNTSHDNCDRKGDVTRVGEKFWSHIPPVDAEFLQSHLDDPTASFWYGNLKAK